MTHADVSCLPPVPETEMAPGSSGVDPVSLDAGSSWTGLGRRPLPTQPGVIDLGLSMEALASWSLGIELVKAPDGGDWRKIIDPRQVLRATEWLTSKVCEIFEWAGPISRMRGLA